MGSETYASPLSFVGGTRRVVGWVSGRQGGARVAVALLVFGFVMPFFYLFLVGWYLLVFGVFGLFTVPWRLHRRSQRKTLAVQQAQLKELEHLRQQHQP